jgi:hypothetical protein
VNFARGRCRETPLPLWERAASAASRVRGQLHRYAQTYPSDLVTQRKHVAAPLSREGRGKSSHDFFHYAAGDVGQAEIAAVVAVGEPLVVDA